MPEIVPTPFFDPAIASRLSGFALQAREAKEGTMSGIHKSPHRGASVEFSEYRDYVPGDDLRRLDWRVFAKTDRFYMKEFEAETNLRSYVVLDGSGSMSYRGDLKDSKFDHARRLSSILSYVLLRQGDAIGLHISNNEKSAELPSLRRPSHLQEVFHSMARFECSGENCLSESLHKLAETSKRRGLFLIFSDFFCDLDSLMPALQHLRHQKHEVALFETLHPQELNFDFSKSTRFKDLEGPAELVVEPSVVKKEYLKFLNNHLEKFRKATSQHHFELIRSLVESEYEQELVRFITSRMNKSG